MLIILKKNIYIYINMAKVMDEFKTINGIVCGTNITGGGKLKMNVRTTTDDITLGDDYILNMNNSITKTVTIPDATSTGNIGLTYVIIKLTSNQVTLTSAVASQIYTGSTTTTNLAMTGGAGQRITITSNGVNWYVM